MTQAEIPGAVTSRSMVEIRHLKKQFPLRDGTVTALDGIDLCIEKGDIFGIIGMSGAGKSTLVRCINLLEKPTEGAVLIDGQNLAELSHRELLTLRRSVSMIFQQFNLLMQRNVMKNVQFPLEIAGWKKRDAKKRALELLRLVGLEEKQKAYPSQLSGGQKQRVAIARALALNPKVLLSDEATSALAPVTTRSILALLKKINRDMGITIIVITHQMNVIHEICNHVAVMNESRIIETGSVENVLKHPDNSLTRKLFESLDYNVDSLEPSRCYRVSVPSEKLGGFFAGIVKEVGVPVKILPQAGSSPDSFLLEIPDHAPAVLRMRGHLDAQGIPYEEVRHVVGC